jgi:hypothetical protein
MNVKDKDGGQLLVSPSQLSGAFAFGLGKLISDFFNSMSQLTAFYRGNNLAINFSMVRYVKPSARKIMTKTLSTMYRFMHPIMLAWSEFARNDDVDRYEDRMSVLVDSCMRMSSLVCGPDVHFPDCLSCKVFNELSDSMENRSIAFSIARVGSFVLMVRIIIIRICALLFDFHKLHYDMKERDPKFVLPFACCSKQILKQFESLYYPDPELLRPPRVHSQTNVKLPCIGDIDVRRGSLMIKGGILACERQLMKWSEVPSQTTPADVSFPRNYLVIGCEDKWLDTKTPRYSELRWEKIKSQRAERVFLHM